MKIANRPASMAPMLAIALTLSYVTARADDDAKAVVTVAFGAGLNTLSSGPPDPTHPDPNHHVIPGMIHVRAGGVVNFVVSGTHIIRVYKAGVKVADVKNQLAALGCTTFPGPNCPIPIPIVDALPVYYAGVLPPAPTAPGTPPNPYDAGPLANAQNRQESVSFDKPGTYLVICAITPHFFDGMVSYVHVTKDD